MRQHFRPLFLVSCALTVTSSATAWGAQVRGRLTDLRQPPPSVQLGYTPPTRVTNPAPTVPEATSYAVFLSVKTSNPLPPPSARWKVLAEGYTLNPSVVVCAVDEAIEFENRTETSLRILVGDQEIKVAPGGQAAFECKSAGNSRVRVAEWPFFRGLVQVEAVGVAAAIDAKGAFALSAPKGTYELWVVGYDGVLAKRDVAIDRADVDLGQIELEEATPPATTEVGGGNEQPDEEGEAQPERTPEPKKAAPPPAPEPAAQPPEPAKKPAPKRRPKPKSKPKPKVDKPADAPRGAEPEGDDDFFELEP